jgi:hypothetical protein
MCVCSDDGEVKKAEDAGWACCEMSSPVLSLGKFTFAERGQRKEAGTRRGKLVSTLEVKGAGAGWVIKVGADAFSSGLMSQPSRVQMCHRRRKMGRRWHLQLLRTSGT